MSHGFDCGCYLCWGERDYDPPEPEPIAQCPLCDEPVLETDDLERGHDGEIVHAACLDVCDYCGERREEPCRWHFEPGWQKWCRLHESCLVADAKEVLP